VYGIPSLGVCVENAHEHVGCQADVTHLLAGNCSGRRACTIDVPNDNLTALTGCPKEYKNFLIVSYKCVKAANSCDSCSSSGFSRLSASEESGYIASIVTPESPVQESCGSPHCPWMIHVQPGQIINLTFFDYSPWSQAQLQQYQQQQLLLQQPVTQALPPANHSTTQLRTRTNTTTSHSSYTGTEYCHRYAIIKERANPKDTNVCGRGLPRERHIYTSISNTLEVHVVGLDVLAWKSQFLIFYEAVGCVDVVPPKFSRMRRREDVAHIDCPADGQSWNLTCVGNKWKGLEGLGTCAPEFHAFAPLNPFATTVMSPAGVVDGGANEMGATGFLNTLASLPFGVVITLVVAVAIIIIVLIVTSGIFCIKKRSFDKKHKPAAGIYGQPCSEFEFRQDIDGAGAYLVPKGIAQTLPAKSRRSSDDLLARDNTYAGSDKHWDSRPLPSIPRTGTDRSKRSGECTNPTHPGHFIHPNYPPTNGSCPNGYPNGSFPNGYPNAGYPGGPYHGHPPNCQHPGRPPYPPHFTNGPPGYPTNGHFSNPPSYPHGSGGGNFNYPGHPQHGGNMTRVAVQMHRPEMGPQHDQPHRRPAPQGTAAVVYRGGAPQQPRPGRQGAQSGDHTYFVLDADAVVDEPTAELVDPLSLPRPQTRSQMRGGGNPPGTNERFRSGQSPENSLPPDRYLQTEPPLMTADGKPVEDIILNPVEHPGTNGKFFVADPVYPVGNGTGPGMTTEQPMFHGRGGANDRRSGSEENWPPLPSDLIAKEQMMSSSPHREGHQNNSLQIALRPARDGPVGQRSVASGSDFDSAADSSRISSLP